ncbi:hypothetical protein ACH4LN_26185 [Streptomyces albus]|uniref:Uncharacterized protein n=1 Tax=Streptomyces albus TaxID=1888 RepID=A0A6C1C4C5_9ACTN|nr:MULTISPECIES: hypothetical protein [Streptomyces]EPD94938.1 hypothetical protein HMPREF1486_02449 [Streptomyces sp. HPH0547]MDI6413092.1 hypothetical protein [Streptomyces albus]QID37844.1 hypothetical protein G3260_004361 [Streptomyces albus]TGG75733.1 hypothetical protein D8771_32590 [Streptomyces albus]UVN55190.1 hypothetical protein NR995_12160 [Streptomyces albus]
MSTEKDPLFPDDLRLLPWVTDTGKPCYLSAAPGGGVLSALADRTENRQLRAAAEVLCEARRVLADPAAGALALRLTLTASARALADTLRVAHSRGLRLGAEDEADQG